MARLFDDASSEYLDYSGAILSSVPMTFAAWVKSDTASLGQWIIAISAANWPGSGSYFVLYLSDTDYLSAASYKAYAEAITTTQWSTGTWHHAAGVFATTSSRSVYLDGGGKGTNATSSTPSSLDATTIGAGYWDQAVNSSPFSGSIAEAAIWNVALTDAEVAILATGVSPRSVRPESLVFYVPLVRDDDEDLVGGLSLTPINTPSISAHPRVFYLATPQIGKTAAAGGVIAEIATVSWASVGQFAGVAEAAIAQIAGVIAN